MSGIVGMYERGGAPAERALLQALTQAISYCGPDAQDTWVNGPIGFGHTMLRTTWESQQERQPASLDGQLWITADARIDCRDELLEGMKRASGTAAVASAITDSELILRAYATWGEECVQHLRGDFSFAIWDARKKLLFCARDHFGIKPFYYAELGELFLFSNVLDCLRKHPDASEELNDAAIGDFLLFGLNCDVATTTFRDIRRLPAAHAMTISSEGLGIQRYWSAPTEGRIRYKRPQDYVEHFQILMQAAVADRMRVDRAGILLSGGLDSGTVASMARELSGSADDIPDLRAYTVVYKSLFHDQEGAWAQKTAEFLNMPIQFIPMDDVQPFERWDDPDLNLPEPVDDPCFAGLFDQFQAISRDCRVVFSGEGNDSLMHFEMWPHVRDMMRNREWRSLLAETSHYAWLRPSPLPGMWRRVRSFIGKNGAVPEFPRWLAPEFARRMSLQERHKQASPFPPVFPSHSVLTKGHASLSSPCWSRMFELESPGVTHCPVEVRHPFFDLRIVNYLLALPPFPLFFEKKLLRQATVGRLPESIRTRRKSPLAGDPLMAHFQRRQTNWMDQRSWNEEMGSYVCESALAASLSETISLRVEENFRALCLKFWLQSARKVQYNFSAEVRNV